MGRIIDYPEISNFTDEDYLVVDGSEGGTRKILGQAVKGVVDSTPTEDSQNAVSSGGVWNSLNDISEEFQSLRSDAYDVYPKKKLTADVVQFDDGAENVPVSEMTAYIYPSMSGSGMPSRTNVRTISGSNSVNVYHANKNLIAPLTYQDAPETVYLGVENSENLLIFFKAGDYHISVKMRDNSAIVPYWVTSGGTPQQSESMHLDADSEVSIYLYDENGVATIDIESFQVEVGINVTDIETHDGEVTNVAFPSGQGDIYLGRVNPVEGKLLIDAIIYERNSSTMNNDENKPGWSYTGLQTYNVEVGTFDTVVYWPDGTVRFTPVNVGSAYSIEYENDDYNVILPVDSYNMTQSQWISLGINIQILITLSTPIEVNIDPIEFRTFYKNNTYFTNSGKLDVEYRLDLAAYVDNQTDMSDKIEKTYPTDTASGAVATFTDGADDIPMKSVKVAIEPVQDLHGYDHPWPAGGGKNILPPMSSETESRNGVTFTRNANGSISMSGTITASAAIVFVEFTLPAGSYTFSNVGSNTSATGANADFYIRDLDAGTTLASISYNALSNNKNFTLTETTNVRFYTVVQEGATISGTVYPMIRKATESDNTYAPYSNICPITSFAGENIWDEEWEVGFINNNGENEDNSYYFRSKNYIPIIPGATYYYKCPTSYSDYARFRFYDQNKQFVSQVGTSNFVNHQFTVPTDAYYMRFTTGEKIGAGVAYNNDISINYPASFTGYIPYSWKDGMTVRVARAGKNLFDKTKTVRGYINDANGELIDNGLSSVTSDYIPVAPNQSYYIKSEQTRGAWGAWYDKNKNYISGITGYVADTSEVNRLKIAPRNAYYMRLTVVVTPPSGESSGNPDTFSVNYPSTDHDYHPFTGNDTYSITFPSEAGTVYGGELDVTNGTLTVDRAMVTLDENGSYYINTYTDRNRIVCNMYDNVGKASAMFVSDSLKSMPPSSGGNGQSNWEIWCSNGAPRMWISVPSTIATVADFKNYLSTNPITVVYELVEPITYHLTPTEIKSLLGDNNIWADAGDTEVTYRADTAMYIEKKLGKDAPMIATSNVVSGSYFMVGSNLYKATANIANGAAVVVGTNAVAITMAEALNEINA